MLVFLLGWRRPWHSLRFSAYFACCAVKNSGEYYDKKGITMENYNIDYCEECIALGNDYYYDDESGDLTSECAECPFNRYSYFRDEK